MAEEAAVGVGGSILMDLFCLFRCMTFHTEFSGSLLLHGEKTIVIAIMGKFRSGDFRCFKEKEQETDEASYKSDIDKKCFFSIWSAHKIVCMKSRECD